MLDICSRTKLTSIIRILSRSQFLTSVLELLVQIPYVQKVVFRIKQGGGGKVWIYSFKNSRYDLNTCQEVMQRFKGKKKLLHIEFW